LSDKGQLYCALTDLRKTSYLEEERVMPCAKTFSIALAITPVLVDTTVKD